MNIILWGYGKMGKAIEQIAISRNHRIIEVITSENSKSITPEKLKQANVVIEFTSPRSAFDNVATCLKNGIPTVSGTTGWDEKIIEAELLCKEHETALVVSSNFSVGVNLFFSFHRWMAQKMSQYKDYTLSIQESHHTQKKDKPSGTAITVAQIAIQEYMEKDFWVLNEGQNILPNEVPIHSTREAGVVGTHTVQYDSVIDTISLTHQAKTREGFALGAVIAAEYIANKKGVFSMKEILGL